MKPTGNRRAPTSPFLSKAARIGCLFGMIALVGCTNVISDAASVVNNRRLLEESYPFATAAAGENVGQSQIVPLDGDVALVLWLETEGAQWELKAHGVGPQGPIGDSTNLSASVASDITFFETAYDGDGNMAVIYGPGPFNEVYVTRYDHAGDQAGHTDIVNAGNTGALGLGSLAFDGEGRILAVYVQAIVDYGTYACLYDPDKGWCSAPTEVDGTTDPVSDVVNPEVVVAGDGLFHVAWSQGVLPSRYTYAARFNPDAGTWSGETQLGLQSPTSRRGIELLDAGSGAVYAIWSGDLGSGFVDLGVATYSPGAGWLPAEQVDANISSINQWIMGDFRKGEASIGYLKNDAGTDRLYLVTGTTDNWSAPVEIPEGAGAAMRDFNLAIDSQGGTVIVRRENILGIDSVLMTRYSPVSGAGRSIEVDPGAGAVGSYYSGMAVTEGGTTYASFAADDGGTPALFVSTIQKE